MNYESEKKDKINDITHFFKKLLMDILQDFSLDICTTNKLFLTQLSLLQKIKSANTINTLANNTFKYQITSVYIIIPLAYPISYSYTTSTNIRYNNFKFKGLLINLDAVTWFTSGFS